MLHHRYHCWGSYPNTPQSGAELSWPEDLTRLLEAQPEATLLPFGNGRSQGDVCLNGGGTLAGTLPLDRIHAFDAKNGTMRCDAGVLLSEVLALTVPRGWFPAVTPGTQFVTVGGAIANDVHGKNHHRVGSYGNQTLRFELLRSDGSRLICSSKENSDWFEATIGGLGLTGLILWAEIQLVPIHNPLMNQEVLQFENLAGFFQITEASDADYAYTLAWVDSRARGAKLGRGILTRGNHAGPLSISTIRQPSGRTTFPFRPPFSLVNRLSVSIFNALYYRQLFKQEGCSSSHYIPFFYPLDGLLHWNRMYGKNGFLQYQCVVPHDQARSAIGELLDRISKSKAGSFIAVLKKFGPLPSRGLLSFPRPGVTLAIDFPFHGQKTLALLESLDGVVREAQGAVYPAKDARMSPESFATFYPEMERFKRYIDPRFSSQLWRRVSGEKT
ncbi:MAG: FAD-binding oxidoreductase [Magnetococcales bacterium]|nr:FAD-binding oxidoreductase [Magnetococcales bacterium]